MRRISYTQQLLALGGVCLFHNLACGPLQVPMGTRLDEKAQANFDAGWRRAMDVDEELGRQGWLDVMISTFAFEQGVDRFHFKSEKRVDRRFVTMEVWFDRAKPQEDAFEITVFDEERKIVRKERYNRADVEESIAVMYPQGRDLQPTDGVNPDAWRQEQQAHEARRARIKLLFPPTEAADAIEDADQPADAAKPANIN